MDEVIMTPIGYVKNEVINKKHSLWGEDLSTIILDEQYTCGLTGLEGFSHMLLWL